MKIAIIFDSKTGNTKRCAEYIAEGAGRIDGIEARIFNITEVDQEFVKEAQGVIIGSPTYFASVTSAMLKWLQTEGYHIGLAGKLGGAFATEQYIHGGGENTMTTILTHELCYGMMVYSSGDAFDDPCIHLGPTAMRQNLEDFEQLFNIYGERFAKQVVKCFA